MNTKKTAATRGSAPVPDLINRTSGFLDAHCAVSPLPGLAFGCHQPGFRSPAFPCTIGLLGISLLLLTAGAMAGEKSGYTLLDPVPTALMREFNTDRPDKTESPYTVDAGHFQFEMDIFTGTRDHDTSGQADLTRQEYAIAPFNLKVGVLPSVDVQLVVTPFVHERIKDRATGAVEEHSGFGDLTARVKVNLWGNDGGATALGLMPFVKFPTSQDGLGNGAVEGGMIIAFAADLPLGFGMGAMSEFDFNQNASGQGCHTEFVNSVTLGRGLFGKLAGYVEFFSSVSDESGADWIGTLDLGLTYALTKSVQLDVGVALGVTKAADDVNFFTGVSLRF